MAKGLVLYQSKYGATKRYAQWLAAETGFDLGETKKARLSQVAGYSALVVAGGIYASGIAGLSFLRKHQKQLAHQKIAVFSVGASPYDETVFRQICEHNLKGELQGIPCFYGRGAWDESAMTLADRTLCKLLQKSVAKQDPAAYEPWQKALMCAVGQSCDWTDPQYLRPLLEWLKAEKE